MAGGVLSYYVSGFYKLLDESMKGDTVGKRSHASDWHGYFLREQAYAELGEKVSQQCQRCGRSTKSGEGHRRKYLDLAMDNFKMTYRSRIPSPPLTCYIDDLYYWSGPTPYLCQKALPASSLNLMVNLGSPFKVYKPNQAEPFITCAESWLIGLWKT